MTKREARRSTHVRSTHVGWQLAAVLSVTFSVLWLPDLILSVLILDDDLDAIVSPHRWAYPVVAVVAGHLALQLAAARWARRLGLVGLILGYLTMLLWVALVLFALSIPWAIDEGP